MTEQATPGFTPATAVPDNTAEPLVLDGQPVAGVTTSPFGNNPTHATGAALYDPYTGALLSSEGTTPSAPTTTPIFDSVPVATVPDVAPEVIAGTTITSPEQRAEVVAALPIGHPLHEAAPILDPTDPANFPGSVGTGGVVQRVNADVVKIEADVVAKINEIHTWLSEIHGIFSTFAGSPMAKGLGL
jgi:hypothetical protein